VVEYKAFEPRSHIMLPTIGHCMTIVNEINRPNFGVNIDMGHALIMKENLAESIALCCRYGKLFHTHWNDNWKIVRRRRDRRHGQPVGDTRSAVLAGRVGLRWLVRPRPVPLSRAGQKRQLRKASCNLHFGFELLDRVPRSGPARVLPDFRCDQDLAADAAHARRPLTRNRVEGAAGTEGTLHLAVIIGHHAFDVPNFWRLFQRIPGAVVYPQTLANFARRPWKGARLV
jgi:hypothetical protein